MPANGKMTINGVTTDDNRGQSYYTYQLNVSTLVWYRYRILGQSTNIRVDFQDADEMLKLINYLNLLRVFRGHKNIPGLS